MIRIRVSLLNEIKELEGLRLKPYVCPAGKLTIGYGRNLDDKGITYEEAENLLYNDIIDVSSKLVNNVPFFEELPDAVQDVLVNMGFQMGVQGLLGFRKTLGYLKSKEWDKAADEMLDSSWAKQTPRRAKRLSNIIRNVGGNND